MHRHLPPSARRCAYCTQPAGGAKDTPTRCCRRKRYDEHGAAALGASFVDGAEFFAALFGSERFEHLVRAWAGSWGQGPMGVQTPLAAQSCLHQTRPRSCLHPPRCRRWENSCWRRQRATAATSPPHSSSGCSMAPLPAALLLALAGAPCVRAWRLRPQLTAAHRTCRHPSRAPPPVPQHAREEKLGVMLGALLRRYVEGDAAGFSESMSAEAASLATASFGDLMLDAIGRVYKAQADIFLGGAWDGSLAALRCSGWCCEGRQAAPAPRGPARLCWGPACTPHHLQISHRAGCPVPQGQGGGHQGAVFGGQPGAEGLQEAA